MTKIEIDRMKTIMDSPAFKQEMLEKLRLEEIRFKEENHRMVDLHFPNHSNHLWKYGYEEYFDCMFCSYTLDCECGEKLKITRGMLDGE